MTPQREGLRVRIPMMPTQDGSGTVPAPEVMTAEEVCRFLRIETSEPERAVRRLEDDRLLIPHVISRRKVYFLSDVERALVRLSEKSREQAERLLQKGSRSNGSVAQAVG